MTRFCRNAGRGCMSSVWLVNFCRRPLSGFRMCVAPFVSVLERPGEEGK